MNETELVFTRALNCDRVSLHLDKARRLTPGESGSVASCLKRRIAGEPLAYILGSCEFMGLEFKTDPRALIPRPETELLVEAAIRYAGGFAAPVIADIGTGSGAIAVSLAKFLPSAKIIAGDISEAALRLAEENASRNGVRGRVVFVRSDLFSGMRADACDMIVANPPYIVSSEIDGLSPEVRSEPRLALDGGPDGLHFYRRICAEASRYLRPGGYLLMEIGAGQRRPVEAIIGDSGLRFVEVKEDYSAIERVIVAAKK